ncbi:histidine kinase dimerization/phosphoacceptor domain -containing protein [Sphingomonas sp.]|uniref:histidine kinase dimerization/phosphoacceptor domain -containing protein n=1 Tax=Sphingomonas sp. TaxID=28214 RepID=UPI003B3B03B1
MIPGAGAASELPIDQPSGGTDITACDREPIHLAGAIQPHGLLLIADATTNIVVAGAGDIEDRLTANWLGRPLTELIAQRAERAFVQADALPGTTVPLSVVPGRREAFDASLFRSGGYLLVELEPRPDIVASAAAILSRLDTIGGRFERAGDLGALCSRAAIAFRELTGFDRVMIYRFLDDAAGTVVAEDRDPSLGSFLNHHFPATDIPRQARALYVRNRVRVIPQVDYVPAVIRPAEAMLGDLDLSDSALRSVSPIHVQYLKNMGVAASASISIVKDGVLWGLVACHNNTPRRLSYETRAACRALAGGLSRQIRAKEEAALYRERIALRADEEAIVGRLPAEGRADRLVGGAIEDVCRLPKADGFALLSGGGLVTTGVCPDKSDILALAEWIAGRHAGEALVTHYLGEVYPAGDAFREKASGLMALGREDDGLGLMMWFRAEQPETVNWAGNPHKDATTPAGELSPRASFELWREAVTGRSRRWTRSEVEAAQHLRRALIEAQQAHRLRTLNRQLNATVTEKESLLHEKDHLLREMNHRVQNSLQLVQAFLGLQAQSADDPTLGASLAEAQRRLSAVALVHRRLYQGDQVDTVDLGRYLDDLLREMREAMGAEWQQGLTLDLAPVLISADRAIHVGLILTELVINANKYAYGGKPGPLDIVLEQHDNIMRLIVADRGDGETGTREGFGTRMMKAMVQRLGGTMERQPNRPGLRVTVSAPIDQP